MLGKIRQTVWDSICKTVERRKNEIFWGKIVQKILTLILQLLSQISLKAIAFGSVSVSNKIETSLIKCSILKIKFPCGMTHIFAGNGDALPEPTKAKAKIRTRVEIAIFVSSLCCFRNWSRDQFHYRIFYTQKEHKCC